MSYLVRVSKTGKHLKTLFVPLADSARDACDQVEKMLGLKPAYGTVCPETGSISHVRWHGYMFTAKAIID